MRDPERYQGGGAKTDNLWAEWAFGATKEFFVLHERSGHVPRNHVLTPRPIFEDAAAKTHSVMVFHHNRTCPGCCILKEASPNQKNKNAHHLKGLTLTYARCRIVSLKPCCEPRRSAERSQTKQAWHAHLHTRSLQHVAQTAQS